MSGEKAMVNRRFLLDKKNIKLEDCKEYIQEVHPQDKKWFYDLCCKPVEITKADGEKESVLTQWVDIKKKFYDKYFPEESTLTKREKLFADWEFE